jgi:putative endonuclease
MRYYVYTLNSLKDRCLYVGFTKNLKERLACHTRGKVRSTSSRRPLKLVHYEYFINEKDACNREVFLKSGYGRDNLKKALKLTLDDYDYKYRLDD